MVSFAKRRVSADAAQNGTWLNDIDGWSGISVFTTALDTDACIKMREDILEKMFGDKDHPLKEQWLRDYVNIRCILDTAVKDIRGITDDLGKSVRYTRDYAAGFLLRPQPADAPVKTPDGLEYDPGGKEIYGMLLTCGLKAGRVREGEEKKQPRALSAGDAAKPQTKATGATKAATDTLTGSSPAKPETPAG